MRWEELLPTALGAALAALLLSRLGVAGTITGAACTPVIITITSAVVSRQIQYARERAASHSAKRPRSWWRRLGERLPRGRRLAAALATAGAAVVIVAAVITLAETIAGKPVSAWGQPGGTGYTFAGGGASSASSTSSTPTETHTTQPQGSSPPPQTSSRSTQPSQSATRRASSTTTASPASSTTRTSTVQQDRSTANSTSSVPRP